MQNYYDFFLPFINKLIKKEKKRFNRSIKGSVTKEFLKLSTSVLLPELH